MPRILLLLLCFISLELSAQNNDSWASKLNVDQLVDTLWDVAFTGLPVVDTIVDELLLRGESEGSFKAKVNGIQGKAENYFTHGKLDSATQYYAIALTLAQNEGDQFESAQCMVSLSSIARDQNQPAKAIEHLQQAISVWEAMKDSSQLCASLIRKAGIETQFDWLDEAMSSNIAALECCGDINDKLYVAHAYNSMATIQRVQKNYEKALELADSSLVIYRNEGDSGYVALQYNNRGVILKNLERYEEARSAYIKGLRMMKKLDSEGRYYRAFHTNLGILENLEGRPDSAIHHCTISYGLNKQFGLTTPMSDCLNEIAKALMTKGKLQAAADTIRSAIELAQSGFSLEKEKDAWETQSKIQSAMGNFKEALNASTKQRLLSDSLFAKKKSNEIARLQALFESEQKDRSIANLAKQNELEQAKSNWLKLGIVTTILAAAFILFGIVQKRKKDKAVLEGKLALERSERERIDEQLDHKKRELTEKALHLAQKNELLQALKRELDVLRTSDVGKDVQAISNKIRFDQQIDKNWEQFTKAFTDTNQGFFDRIRDKHPEISKSELRLSALLTMHLNSKEVGNILNISDEGVRKARYRLRKRLELNKEDKLERYLATI